MLYGKRKVMGSSHACDTKCASEDDCFMKDSKTMQTAKCGLRLSHTRDSVYVCDACEVRCTFQTSLLNCSSLFSSCAQFRRRCRKYRCTFSFVSSQCSTPKHSHQLLFSSILASALIFLIISVMVYILCCCNISSSSSVRLTFLNSLGRFAIPVDHLVPCMRAFCFPRRQYFLLHFRTQVV